MIETLKDMKHGRKDSYGELNLERTASQILHHMEDKDSEDSLESTRSRVLANAKAIYGSTRHLDVISYAPTSSRKIGAAIVEHNPTGRSYIHCSSAKEDTRLAATEHLLVITEDILQRLMDKEGISSSGWLPATAQAQHAAACASVNGSITGSIVPSISGSVPASRRSSVQPQEHIHGSPQPHHNNMVDIFPKPNLIRNNSDMMYPSQPLHIVPRANSDIIAAPKPMPVGRFHAGQGRVKWNLGSES
ncbi:uncharacterized protein BDR25DRAFT_310215 [Lindgomyces ingoldianus]|uniref:Uncharacterized protein n=1 Tax=Lindgomyces ingoldianus TaxID=673940 RepID=A0ACB6R8Y3_9PLEO|nr:uncharacterized protein BDR25DRAFT_310215 [Lindgomyces ingoldianus]KAF2475724.1 hypothetical protein BDR25DRAFT_310215 [Lindgomyces ingoldianus]